VAVMAALTATERALCEQYAAMFPNLSGIANSISAGMHKTLKRYGSDDDDIHSTAWIGVLDAAKKFDQKRGVEFRSYAKWRIKNALHIEVAKVTAGKRNPEFGEFVPLTGEERVECRSEGVQAAIERVQEALDALPDDQRRLLEMRYGLNGVKRLPHRVLANRLGIAYQTLGNRLRKAKAAARKILEAD
jgi:RNA polymerase sigma factor (sigma-70 family)